MSVLLLNPPISRYDSAELSPPLSLLRLSQAARRKGIETSLIDLNLPPHREMADHPDLYGSYVLEMVARSSAQEVGITSMGVNSHVAIWLANLICEHIGIPVVLGGLHFSSISEVAKSLCPPLACLATPSLRGSPDNREKWWASEVQSGTMIDADISSDIRDLFKPVDLDGYFAFNHRRVANLETGRGCKYNCAFCYSPDAYPSWFNYNIENVVSSFMALRELGFRHAFLIQDNLLNDPLWLEGLAKRLCSFNLELSWNGYATLPDLKPSILPLLAASGCCNLYIGLDSADKTQQKSWNKSFSRDDISIINLVKTAADLGMVLTCAFIIDPDPAAEMTIFSALDSALRLRAAGAEIRLSVLTPYPRTKFFRSERLLYSEERAAVLMDLPEVVVRNSYAPKFIDAFPWHSRPSSIEANKWQTFLLSVNSAQYFLNSTDEEIDQGFPCSGEWFWRRCQEVAFHVSCMGELHKTELREVFHSASLSLARR